MCPCPARFPNGSFEAFSEFLLDQPNQRGIVVGVRPGDGLTVVDEGHGPIDFRAARLEFHLAAVVVRRAASSTTTDVFGELGPAPASMLAKFRRNGLAGSAS